MFHVHVRSYAPIIRDQTKKTGVTKCNTADVKRDFEGDWTFTAFGPAIWAGQYYRGMNGGQGESLVPAYTRGSISLSLTCLVVRCDDSCQLLFEGHDSGLITCLLYTSTLVVGL